MSKLKKTLCWIAGIAISLPLVVPMLKIALMIVGSVLIMLFYAFSWSIGLTEKDVYQYSFPIEAMKDNVTYVQSRYDTDSELKYYFVRDYGGTSNTGWVDAGNSSIVEDGKSEVLVFANEPKFGKKLWHKSVDLLWQGDYPLIKSYEFHIPSGSIEKDFNIDLE